MVDDDTITVAAGGWRPSSEDGLGEDASDRRYLLVFVGDASSVHPLPTEGQLVIGRADTADVRVKHEAVSRSHARLTLGPSTVNIKDLGSQNGTFVNGVAVKDEQPLEPGDVISIRDATLILHTSGGTTPAALLAATAFRKRLEDEVDRAVRYERSLSVLALVWKTRPDRQRVERIVTTQLRRIDAATWTSSTVMHALLAETQQADAESIARRLQQKLGPLAVDLQTGLACTATEGYEAAALLASAHSAANSAGTARATGRAQDRQERTIAGQRVLIADPSVMRLYALIERLAPVDLPILVTGETGCGKELVATAIHSMSRRASKQLVTLNCAAIQDTLVESELFGHERGAFTGAVSKSVGLIEAASGSTLFLDEIGELALGTQAKLLRVLETHKVMRVGDVRERDVDVRIVAATHRDLEAEVEAGRFRQDLYFRLSGATLHLPPLRQRPRELPMLAVAFLDEACARNGRGPIEISERAMAALLAHRWPGNVRELKNLMQYIAAAHEGAVLEGEHVAERLGASASAQSNTPGPVPAPAPSRNNTPTFQPIADELKELEAARMRAALEATEGNQTKAAALLSMPVRTFFEKVKHYGLQPKKKA